MSKVVVLADSAFASARPRAALWLCLVLFAACTFDSGNLRRSKSGDAGGGSSISGDAAGAHHLDAGPEVSWDVASFFDLRAAGNDTRDSEPDSALVTGSPDADGAVDLGRDADDAPLVMPDADSTLDGGGAEADAPQEVDAPADASRPLDGAVTDPADAHDEVGDAASAEAGEFDPDGGSDADSVGDDAAPDSGPAIDPDLVLWYRFDESGGTIAYDSAQKDGVARNAVLLTAGTGGSALFSTASQVGTNALALTPAPRVKEGGGYVVIPALNELAPDAVTIAVWVRLAVAGPAQNWERIYDFADSPDGPRWLAMTARNDTAPYGPMFNMSKTGHDAADHQKLIGMTALTANTWHHIAVVLPEGEGETFTGVMYVNGEVAATNDAMTVHLRDLGPTTCNWMGRSQYTDPYFNGSFDDFRVYSRALKQEEIQALMALR